MTFNVGGTVTLGDLSDASTLYKALVDLQTQISAIVVSSGVTSFSFVNANGFTGTVATPTSTPALTLTTAFTLTTTGSSGAATYSGGTLNIPQYSGGASGLTVGTTTITSGTTTRVLFDNAGVLGEYAISGTGNVAMTTSPTFTTPALGTPSALVGTNITGTGASFTAGTATAANGINSATTTVVVNGATAPTNGQVLTATSGTAATWQTPGGGSGTVTHTAGALTANAVVIGNAGADITVLGSLGTTTTVLHGNASGAPTFGAVNLGTDVTGALNVSINAQTGTTYTVVAGDQSKLVTMSNGASVAVTLPQATGSFTTGWATTISNKGAGVVTITPTTSTIDGRSSVVLNQYESITVVSDGTNYSSAAGKENLTLTTTGTSGAATLTGTVLNVPNYATGGGSVVPGTIVGCQPGWVSTTQASIGSGQLYIEGTNSVIAVAAQTITPTLSASAWFAGYVNSSGTFSLSTSSPIPFATPCGFALSKTGDTNSRFVGWWLTDGSSHLYQFYCGQEGIYKWKGQNPGASPFRVLSAGNATTSTNVSCSGAASPTARQIFFEVLSTQPGGNQVFVSSGDITVSSTNYEIQLTTQAATSSLQAPCNCDASQTINYLNSSASSAAAYIDVIGFLLQR